jgi:trans-2,3-dihydro-3-hydroxyanthranilate isomerase
MRNYRYVLADVFTDRPLTGNPLAVFTDGRGLSTETQQAIAREMNLSETVFVLPPEKGGHARLRIYTPRQELPFAGHPVLGTAFVLGGPLQSGEMRLETGVGIIPVRLERDEIRIVFGWMQQPIPEQHPFTRSAQLCAALGIDLGCVALPITEYSNGPHHLLAVLDDVERVRALTPDLGQLGRDFPVTVSVAAGSGDRYVTRVFAPAAGVPEDPATGSAAGPLALHLARHGRIRFGERLYLEQGTGLMRPSELHAVITGSAERIERVDVGGSAVLIARGELRL